MNKIEIKKAENLAKRFLSSSSDIEARNELFNILAVPLQKWMKTILQKRGLYLPQGEILSKSWDCFDFCLQHYSPEKNILIPNHFYTYTKFFILNEIINRKDKHIQYISPSQNLENLGDHFDETYFDVLDDIEELRKFKERLPPKYHSVFDDALMSLAPNNNQNLQRLNVTSLGYAQYHEVKKIFKIIIEFLLMR